MRWIEALLKTAIAFHFGAMLAAGFGFQAVAIVCNSVGNIATFAAYTAYTDTE